MVCFKGEKIKKKEILMNRIKYFCMINLEYYVYVLFYVLIKSKECIVLKMHLIYHGYIVWIVK